MWQLQAAGRLTLHELNAPDMDRMSELMDTCRDKPVDLADASIVAAAESLGTQGVFALDADFHTYRLADGLTFQFVP